MMIEDEISHVLIHRKVAEEAKKDGHQIFSPLRSPRLVVERKQGVLISKGYNQVK